MDKDQLIIHGIVNNSIGGGVSRFLAMRIKHQLDIQNIIESRIQKLVPQNSINDECLFAPIRIIVREIIQFLKGEDQYDSESLRVRIESIIDNILNEELSLISGTCICCILVDDNISFKDLTDLAVAVERLHEYTGLSMPDIESIQISQKRKINTFGGR